MLSTMKTNKIYCGDNAKLIKLIPDDFIDLTVTSPPYDDLRNYNGYQWNFEIIAKELFRVTKPGGVVVWVVGDATIDGSETLTSFKQAIFFREHAGFNLHDTMIYQKNGSCPCGSNLAYFNSFEYMFVLSKGKPKTFNPIRDVQNKYAGQSHITGRRQKDGTIRSQSVIYPEFSKRQNIWKYSVGFLCSTADQIAYQHPATFPETLARDHILSWSNEGDIVFDPFVGSGTTAKVAYQCQREYIGFEISIEYVDIANERLKQRTLFE